MEISKAAIGVVAAVCVTAGAAGVYLAPGGGQRPVPEPVAAEAAVGLDPSTPAPDPIVTGAATPLAQAAPVVERQAAPVRPAAARPRQFNRATAPAQATPALVDNQPPTAWTDIPGPSSPILEPARTLDLEPARTEGPVAPEFVELVIPAESVLGLQVETSVTSERARVEEEVVARVTRDVRVGDRVAIPSGAKAYGEVTLVERGGRLRDRARLGVRFTSVVLTDGTRIPIETDTIYREGDAPGGESAAKVGGGAIGGAIIGGILGGARGAVIGGSVGAGAGTAAVFAGGRNAATLPSGTPITVRLTSPAAVTVAH